MRKPSAIKHGFSILQKGTKKVQSDIINVWNGMDVHKKYRKGKKEICDTLHQAKAAKAQ